MKDIIELEVYQTENGKVPFANWLKSLKDVKARAKVLTHLAKVRSGNLGDYKSISGPVGEFRIHYGPGYRIYFAHDTATKKIILLGGSKRTQAHDAEQAKQYWQVYIKNREK